MGTYLIGTDVGTTGTKSLLFTTDGTLLSHAYRPYALMTPQVGYSEQNAEDWWKATVETIREILTKVPDPENVAAISLSLQGGTVVPVDEYGTPLRPAIVWNDARCAAEFEEFKEEGGSAEYAFHTSGWSMGTGLPVLETRWIRNHEPEVFKKTAYFLTVPDYISMKMCGIPAVDLADAGINEFCDIRKGAYDPKMLSFAGITEAQLPKIVRSGEVIGPLTKAAAEELGLTEKTILVAGAHDQYAVAVGGGANAAGDVMIGSGTAWVVTGIAEKPAFESGLSQSVAVPPGKWGSIFSLSSGGVCLEWLRRNVALGADGAQLPYDEINARVAGRSAAEEGLFFYPFQGIAGKGKRFRKASFVGLDLSHDRYDIASAIMEGTVFQTKWMMENFDASKENGSIRLAGGATKSPVWSQMVADITGKAVRIPEIPDLACVGAAVIAGWGCGIYRSVEEGCAALRIPTKERIPDPAREAMYEEAYERYKKAAELLYEYYSI